MNRLCCRARSAWQAVFGLALVFGVDMATACSQDMEEQASYQAEEGPRKHSPEGSVPRESRAVLPGWPTKTAAQLEEGARLFRINCAHCHGPQGDGDGPVAGYLEELPTNLRNPQVRSKSDADIYDIVTRGKEHRMPSFKGFLSVRERWAVAFYVKAMREER